MDEIWLRVALIGGALAVAASVTMFLRWRATGSPSEVEDVGLDVGVYLFTSSACPDCASVRRTLTEELGGEGFEEVRWEEDPGLFHRLGIDAVPATLVVNRDGSGMLWPGRPEDALASLGP